MSKHQYAMVMDLNKCYNSEMMLQGVIGKQFDKFFQDISRKLSR